MLRNSLAVVAVALALVACGDDGGDVTDAGGTPDSGGSDAGRPDSSTPRPDSGPGDECVAEMAEAASTVGCNGGFIAGEQPANADFGPCTGGDDADPNGSCTAENTFCFADPGAAGICFPLCDPGSEYVSTGGCPTGSRCFPVGDAVGACFRDCDDAHACPGAQNCDPDGSCIPEDAPPVDGGVEPDAGTEPDGGIVLPDASTDADGGEAPDAGVAP